MYYDFSEINLDSIDEDNLNQRIDSLAKATHLDSLRELSYYITLHKGKNAPGYFAFLLGFEVGQFSFNELNRTLKTNGFDPLTETLSSINFGMEQNQNRWLWSWLFNVKIKERIQNEEVRLSFANSAMFTFAVGYDLFKVKRIQFYPQLAVSYQKFSVDVRRKGLKKNEDIMYYIDNPYESNFKKRSLAGQLGAQLDILLNNPKEMGGFMLTIRGGVQKTLIDGDYKMHHRNYGLDLGDVGRQSYFSVGLKIFARE